MSHIMRPLSFGALTRWITKEYESAGSVFGIHKSLFYVPKKDAAYSTEIFGRELHTPFGPAAGPNSQLAQNIVSAWLCGARFIELKTVQIMDELEIARPCIDMEAEGYNVEWSQELKLEQSVQEYVKGWVLIHALQKMLDWDEKKLPFGTVFNMSVGYNLEGIKSPRMQKFMDTLTDASEHVEKYLAVLRKDYPALAGIQVPGRIIESVTLSTMHGCPPDEIQKIGLYLLEEKNLHLILKLNPTLIGKAEAMEILHGELGLTHIEISDDTFGHDLQYPRALEIVSALKKRAAELGLFFGVKLSNTLAMVNRKNVLPGDEMYMSGTALYPITTRLFARISEHFKGELPVSYSAGADELNVRELLAMGAMPVTMASDLLKPGGYAKFRSYIEAAEDANGAEKGAANNRRGQAAKPGGRGGAEGPASTPKFDCIKAPCAANCPVCQDVPSYAWQIANGDIDGALATILSRNAMPGVTGHVCPHTCQSACTRNDYESPVAIRALKRFAAEHGNVKTFGQRAESSGFKAAVIGAGPSGLAAAASLALRGVSVTVYEEASRAGGMMALAPAFRLPGSVLDGDVKRIADLGVKIELNHKVSGPPEELLNKGFDAVYAACGFPEDADFGIPGLDAAGVFTSIKFLKSVASEEKGEKPALGSRAVVIGGGNTAMDAARTAARLTGNPVSVVYRRTRAEMPAAAEEQALAFEEGNTLIELASPAAVLTKDGRVTGLECEKCRLGEPDASGRRAPVPTGERFTVECDSVIVAIGQGAGKELFRNSRILTKKNGALDVRENGATSVWGVFSGGDAARTPATVVQGCADGARAADAICEYLGLPAAPKTPLPALTEDDILSVKAARAHKSPRHEEPRLPLSERRGFEMVEAALSAEDAAAEARRCLQCAAVCDKCVEVCPNRANVPYKVTPILLEVPKLRAVNGALSAFGAETVEISQARQVLHVDDFCNECGNCASFCPHGGRPYADKPRLVLNEPDFAAQDDNVFKIDGSVIRRRDGGRESRLTVVPRGYIYENDFVSVELDNGFAVKSVTPRGRVEDCSLRGAVEMAVMYTGIAASAPWLAEAGA